MTVGLYQNERPVVVYRATSEDLIYYQTALDSGTVWGAPKVVPGVRTRAMGEGDQDAYSMATDSAGQVHLILSGYRADESPQTAQLELLHLTWDGRAWSKPEVVANNRSYPDWTSNLNEPCDRPPPPKESPERQALCETHRRYAEWPRAVISGGNQLHITWFTRSQKDIYTSDNAHYQIWYTSRNLNAPAIQGTPLPTPLPPTPTPSHTPSPTPKPIPTLGPEAAHAPEVGGRPSWELPGMVVLVLAALPTIVLLGLFIAVRLMILRRQMRTQRRAR
jgi:hypothetical protein